MKRMESDCLGCGRPEYCGSCQYSGLSAHYYCDKCQFEIEPGEIYIENGQELCEYCLKELHLKKEDDDE